MYISMVMVVVVVVANYKITTRSHRKQLLPCKQLMRLGAPILLKKDASEHVYVYYFYYLNIFFIFSYSIYLYNCIKNKNLLLWLFFTYVPLHHTHGCSPPSSFLYTPTPISLIFIYLNHYANVCSRFIIFTQNRYYTIHYIKTIYIYISYLG